ncbi:hybrid sensor histidine kinase/response regulator transcription factor [Gelidibacter mesophilus]|uniref:hybrid sensor histidine kinase/response regulator transcription factor n=1 Tax=Gelidibacter mesophilus TaxID=169050 RepID=UPI0004892B06|nr:two-component regulator propeller domain-containing protein [Gelidibacter mesophilus]
MIIKNQIFILFLFICHVLFGFQINQNITLSSLNLEQGLTQNYITCTIQDSEGFMWIGTRNGLYKYDGYNFIQIPLVNKYYGYNEIRTLYQDKENNIWIGTNNGPVLYNFHSGEISSNPIPKITKGKFITSFFSDDANIIYMGTTDGDLIRYQKDPDEIRRYNLPNYSSISSIIPLNEHELLISYKFGGVLTFHLKNEEFFIPNTLKELSGISINKMTLLNSGTVVLATDNGIYFWRTAGNLLKIQKQNSLRNSKSLNSVISIFEMDHQKIWFGTDGYGLFEYDILTGELYDVEFGDDITLSAVTSIYKSEDQSLWIGTVNQGLKLSNPHKSHFNHWTYEKGNATGLSSNSVLGISEINNGGIVLALDGGGMNLYNPKSKQFNFYFEESENLKINNAVHFDKEKRLWLGTLNHGSQTLKLNDHKTLKSLDISSPNRLNHATIKCFLEDKEGKIWIGSANKGIYIFNSKSNKISEFKPEHYINSLQISSIYQTNDAIIWIASYSGLYAYNPIDDTIVEKLDTNDLSMRQLTSIIESDENNLWVASKNGLYHLKRDEDKTTLYTTKNGLSSNVVNSLLLESSSHLWMGTDRGLSQLAIETREFRNFGKEDGIVGLEFNEAAALKSSNGILYFGNTHGVYYFKPDEIKINPIPPKIIITEFDLYDRKKVEHTSVIPHPINQLDEIKLKHDQNFFTFHFTGINFTNAAKNEYSYRLVGVDEQWINSNKERKAPYTNIPPGDYEFQIKASNNDGLWNSHIKTIKVLVASPWWATIWVKSIFILLFTTILIFINIYILKKIKLKEAFKAERLEKNNQILLNEFKTKFFTNLTHELKTPLTMIISSLGKIINATPPNYEFYNQLLSIQRNSNNLTKLINEWFDYRKIKLEKTKLNMCEKDFRKFSKDIVHTFTDLAEDKSISINFHSKNDTIPSYIDPVEMEKVISNLISNAIKYSDDNSIINIETGIFNQTDTKMDLIYFTVTDNGKGILWEKQDHIFERFYDFDEDPTISTGIGLSLSNEIVEMHHGKLEFRSTPGKGSIFSVFLPVGNDHFTTDQLKSFKTASSKALQTMKPKESFTNPDLDKNKPVEQYGDYTILIVEDEPEIRIFIETELSESFKVITAKNGEEGLEIAIKNSPDLILSDILMPKLSGLEFCRKIKNNISTSHIPFILLTALSDEETQINGLNYGAEDYITKPFNINTLIQKVKSILENRKIALRKYKIERTMEPKDLARSNPDKDFLEKVVQVIQHNISDSNFTIDHLVQDLGMSRTPFFKKIKSLTSLTPNEFIKTVRLRNAAELLITSDLNVSEISYEIGFLSTKHFSSLFKKQFKDTPSNYRAKNQLGLK